MHENQRQDFDTWGRIYLRELYYGAPVLQRDPISRIAQMGERVGAVVYETSDARARERQEADEAFRAVNAVMARLHDTHPESFNCLMARHAGHFRDARGVAWKRGGLPEHRVAVAMFGGNREASRKRFQRACERGYMAYRDYCDAA